MKKNKGSVLIIILITVALVAILATMILVMTKTSYEIKSTAEKTNKNFYNCETALDEIKANLQVEIMDCYIETYIDVNESSSTEDQSTQFYTLFTTSLSNRLKDPIGNGSYDVDKLNSYLSAGMLYDDTTKTGIKIEDAMSNSLYTNGLDGIVLKNVDVTYFKSENSSTRIVTDIYLDYPPVYFSDLTDNPPIMQYALIADKGITVEGLNNKIVGSVYCGSNGVDENSLDIAGGNILLGKASLTLYNSVYAVINGDINIGNQSELITLGYTGLWGRNILLGNSSKFSASGDTNLVNDIYMNANSDVTIEGSYYGFGNPSNYETSQYLIDNNITAASSANDPRAEHSSAMLINGKSVNLDLEGTYYLLLGGTASIGTHGTGGIDDLNLIKTGESIGVKGNQTAYLVPSSYMKNNCENPTTYTNYLDLNKDCVNLEPSKYEVVYYTMPGDYTLVQFFMKFETVEEAADYFENYYQINGGYVNDIMEDYDTNIKLPDEGELSIDGKLLNEYNTVGNTIEYTALIGKLKSDILNTNAKEIMSEKEDMYGMICKTLKTTYSNIPETQKTLTVVENVLDYNNYRDAFMGIYADDPVRIYETEITTTDETFTGIIVNADTGTEADKPVEKVILKPGTTGGNSQGYSYNSFTKELTIYPNKINLRILVTYADVEVDDCNYNGLLISKGKVTIKDGSILTNIPKDIALTMFAENEDDIRISDVFVEGSRYLIGGSENDQSIFSDLVTFVNWEKE